MKRLSRKFFAASMVILSVVSTSVFAQKSKAEDELKKQILSSANLNGVSADELMAEDSDDDIAKGKIKRGPVTGDREVIYTESLKDFIGKYFNHQVKGTEHLEELFNKAVESAKEFSDEYSKNVHFARCHYFYGQQLMESFDLASLKDMDLTDSKDAESVNERAGSYYDKAIEYAQNAVKIKNGTDALSIWAHSISANCTAKNVAYILSNGLKVRSYARTATKVDYSNGTAHFLASAQDIYAPKPFNKAKKARKEMMSYLNDSAIRLEEFDRFNIYSSIGYSYFIKKDFYNARIWYKKCQDLYPENLSTKNMLSKVQK